MRRGFLRSTSRWISGTGSGRWRWMCGLRRVRRGRFCLGRVGVGRARFCGWWRGWSGRMRGGLWCAGRWWRIPGHKRAVRWAGQRAYLFPWMTVEENVAFGLKADSSGLLGRGWIDEVARAMEAFHLTELSGKRPRELSGGQAQRVAVARAAVGASGRRLLLDEPFAGLDAKVRDELIVNLRSWLGETPVVSVTHDVGEAFLLGAEVVRIAEGRVVAQGPVAEVLAEERKRLLGVLG